MTGYLHIPTDELAPKLAQWFQVTLSYHNFKTWDDGQFGGEMVEFLRGLSVEPTDEAAIRADERQQLAARLYRAIDAILSSPAHRLRMDPGTALDGIERVADYLRNVGPAARVEPAEDDRSPARCRAYAAVLMGVVPELDDRESAELVTARAMQWEAEADRPSAAPVPVQEDRPTCEHGKTDAHWYPSPSCVEHWPECGDGEYNPACCRFPKSCSADEQCPGPAAESEDSALVVQEDRP